MKQVQNISDMTEPIRMIKISEKNYDRLKKFGFAGESINTALQRALDELESLKKKR